MDLKNIDVKKVIIFSALGVGVIIGGTIAVKRVIGLFEEKEGKDEIKESKKEIVKSDLSFSDAAYETMANSLYTAMNGIWTNVPTITRIIAPMRTKSDYLKTLDTFGVKKSTTWLSSFEGNLSQWLVDELATELESTRDAIYGKLNSLGIIL